MNLKKAIIMCQTPLQALISEKIMERNPEIFFTPVYTAYEWNHKHDHYANRLLRTFPQGIKKEIPSLEAIASLVEELAEKDFNQIYLASIDAPLNLALLSAKKDLELITYDDGSANITPRSFYFKKLRSNPVYPGLNITWDREKVKLASKKHYTIFDSSFNIVPSDRLEKIDLFDFSTLVEHKPTGKICSVLIGQPILSGDANEQLMASVMDQFQIDYYCPHPREERYKRLEEKAIETNLIFEEYCLELLEVYDEVTIYHFVSTVAFNLKNHPRVKTIVVNQNYYDSWYFEQ